MSKFYVYVHKRVDNDEVFYVGKGSGLRYKRSCNRSENWNKIVKEAGGFTCQILFQSDSECEIFDYEKFLILKLLSENKKLANRKVCSDKVKDIDEDLCLNFEYDESSPSCLVRVFADGKKKQIKTMNSKGYYQVIVNKKIYICHRIIWFMFNKCLDKTKIIDHIDSDRSNNKIKNLQEISKSENQEKRTKLREDQSWASSGIKNISISSDKSKITVHYTLNGKFTIKSFVVNSKRNFEEALNQAIQFKESLKSANIL